MSACEHLLGDPAGSLTRVFACEHFQMLESSLLELFCVFDEMFDVSFSFPPVFLSVFLLFRLFSCSLSQPAIDYHGVY